MENRCRFMEHSAFAECTNEACLPACVSVLFVERMHVCCREKQYDLRIKIPVYTVGSGTQPHLVALTYVATADRTANPNYLGPAPLDDVARQIATACGPSGPNYEYLFRLADAMRQMEVQDEDLFMLEVKSGLARGLWLL